MVAGASIAILVFLLPMLVMLIVGIFLIITSRQRGKAYPACGACQYDLSGSVGSVARCPECGADFKTVGISAPAARRNVPMLVAGIVLLVLPVTCVGGLVLTSLARSARPAPVLVPAAPPTAPPPAPTQPADEFNISEYVSPSTAPPATAADHPSADAEIDTTEP